MLNLQNLTQKTLHRPWNSHKLCSVVHQLKLTTLFTPSSFPPSIAFVEKRQWILTTGVVYIANKIKRSSRLNALFSCKANLFDVNFFLPIFIVKLDGISSAKVHEVKTCNADFTSKCLHSWSVNLHDGKQSKYGSTSR